LVVPSRLAPASFAEHKDLRSGGVAGYGGGMENEGVHRKREKRRGEGGWTSKHEEKERGRGSRSRKEKMVRKEAGRERGRERGWRVSRPVRNHAHGSGM